MRPRIEIANPALTELAFLVGTWDMELFQAAFLPDPESRVRGKVTFAWIADGAALVMSQGGQATWIIGRDEAERDFHVLYADSRGVSRVYQMSFADRTWRLWRETPEFSQRFAAQVSGDGQTISGHWEKSVDRGASWEHDFSVTYSRAPSGAEG